MSVLLAHGVRGPRLHTSCLCRARTVGCARTACGTCADVGEIGNQEIGSHESPDNERQARATAQRQARMGRERHLRIKRGEL